MKQPLEFEKVGAGIRYIRLPRRYDIPIIGRFLYWRLNRKFKKLMNMNLGDIVIHTGIPKDKWQGAKVGLRE